ncbi:Peptidase family S41 [Propionispira arboris]|uniref:Peptidase family S41 n=2 Tax=Propionispira arboris TaxID=84035 RepID=A0A1H7A776_9FIRM|nr:Peptidase family S41 [Propionispira arboris]
MIMPPINWPSDLTQLAVDLPNWHKNLFFQQTKKEFFSRIDVLKQKSARLDIHTIVIEIAKIVATIGDAHTAVVLPRYNRLPIEVYCFQEGLFVVAAMPTCQNLLWQKLIAINGETISSICKRLEQVISHENQSFVLAQLPEYLICTDILFGLGIIDDLHHVTIQVETDQQKIIDCQVHAIKYEDWQDVLTEQKQEIVALPLYRQHPDQYYWSHLTEDKGFLYVNYNKCKNMTEHTVEYFSSKLIKRLEDNLTIQYLAIDLRNNGGGNSELLKDFLHWLGKFKRLNQQGHLFVIVGRDTFSSALLNVYYLKYHSAAIFIGEATGGKPNCYGEVKYLSLASSGLAIRYSTQYYKLIEDETQLSFEPDVVKEVTFQDYKNHIDPCLEWIYQQIQVGPV